MNAADGIQVGTDDFRISDMGPDGDINFDAYRPDVAYSASKNQYLVVWYGDDNSGALVNNDYEVFGQLLDGATGVQTGDNDFLLSELGPDGSALYGGILPRLAFNTQKNLYLIVFQGDDNIGEQTNDNFEIYGQMFQDPIQLFLPMLRK